LSQLLAGPLAETPDAVLVDLDDTLYAYAPAHASAIEAVGARCADRLGLDAQAFEPAFDAARKRVKGRLKGTAAAHHRLLYFQVLIESTTGKSDPGLSLELEKTYWRRFMATARLFPGARDMIDELRYAKIPIALVTDLTAQIQMRKLVYFDLEHAFDVVVTSEDAGAEKPEPPIFALALEKLGLEPGKAKVWMIGESAARDIRGARDAVGARTIQKVHAGVEQAPEADLVIKDFVALADAVRQKFVR